MVPDWMLLVGTATVLWSFSDICSDSAIESSEESSELKREEKEADKVAADTKLPQKVIPSKLDGMQGAAVSVTVGCLLAMLMHIFVIGYIQLSMVLLSQVPSSAAKLVF